MCRLLATAVCLAAACATAPGAEAQAPATQAQTPAGDALIWTDLPPLPPGPGQDVQPGVAGPFVGVHGGRLIVAGGANFPDAPPWLNGTKVWWDHAFVLDRTPHGIVRWIRGEGLRLPRPCAYGASVDTRHGVVMIGGCEADACLGDVRIAAWDGSQLAFTSLPDLPRPLAFMAGAKVGDAIYVAGGQETMADARATTNFWRLDLSQYDPSSKERNPDWHWEELEPWPGPPRILPVAAGQSDGAADCFYLFSGRNVAPDVETQILTDAFTFSPRTGVWTRLAEVGVKGEPPRSIMAASAVASGAHHILVFGGGEGERFLVLERLSRRIKEARDRGNIAEAIALARKNGNLLRTHPGFSRDILAYHTITDTWTRVGRFPDACPVTTTAVKRGGSILIPSGEVRPGVRTPMVWKADPPPARPFGWINYTVLGVYLAALVAMGVYFSRREKTTDDFFKAGGRVPWWAAGLSIYGTQLSAITFMAIPAKTFATDWRYFMGNVAIVMVAPLIIFLILPFFRRLNVTTAYEYLEKRFNVAARLFGSIMFMLLHLGRIGIILFLPSIALSVVTGIDVRVCIVVMAVLSITYTVLGGIEAVIWTDVLQVVVLLGGAWVSLALMLAHIPGGLGGMIDLAAEAGKFHTFDFRFDLTTPTFWVVLLGGLAANFISYGSDQTVIQRYLTTRDEKAAGRAIWTNALLVIPGSLLFFGMGAALYAFFKTRPDLMSPTLENADAVFPWYIVTQLPTGVAGLLIAALFAAAMSSLDSSMNSVATAVTTDFYRRFRPLAADRTCLRLARRVTVVVGLAGMVLALLMTGWDIRSLWDEFSKVIGLFAGGLGGLFLLGIFSRRAHGAGALVGLAASAVVQFTVSRTGVVYLLLYSFTGVVTCVVVGYLASLIIPARPKPLAGLTLYTLQRKDA
ncbi:MAG TPA: sodium/solute symporter [Phycisphaerae bacterium]|nr:sodium/solute symporter [Phycisphaerae bacterium]